MCAYQEGAQHVEGDEVNYCESTATRHLLPGVVVGLWVAQFPRHAGQHDLLPRLSSGAPGATDRHGGRKNDSTKSCSGLLTKGNRFS